MLHAYVSSVSEVCCICCNSCTCMWQTSVPNVSSVFRRMLQVCLSKCCICFTHRLEVFYVDVAYVCNGFHVFFFCMLQVLHLDVSKVDQVLHMGNRRGREQSPCRRRPSGTVQASDVQATWAPCGRAKQDRNGLQPCSSRRPSASSTVIWNTKKRRN
jgi:hypothetical protein